MVIIMEINVLPVGPLYTNCYILESNKKNAMIIDAGDNAKEIIKFCQGNGLNIAKLVFTHGHFDHVGAMCELVAFSNAKTYIHPFDEEFMLDPKKSQSRYFQSFGNYIGRKADVCYADGDIISLDDISLKVMHTPGHTKGSSVLIGDGVIFSGDTLFAGGVGRTDLFGGDEMELVKSLRRLAAIEGDFEILTGHGESTRLAHERRTNPYMGQNYEDIF